MAEFEFTSHELIEAGDRIEAVSDHLDERERSMLLGIFQLAADRVATAGATVEQGGTEAADAAGTLRVSTDTAELPSLTDGFRDAFTPGAEAGELADDGGGGVSVGVSVGVTF